MYQNISNSRRKLYEPTITNRATFAPRDRLSALAKRGSWALMYVGVDVTAAPLPPKPWRDI